MNKNEYLIQEEVYFRECNGEFNQRTHPEIRLNEVWVTNCSSQEDFNCIGYKTKRRGLVAFCSDGTVYKSGFPVFVSAAEYNAEPNKLNKLMNNKTEEKIEYTLPNGKKIKFDIAKARELGVVEDVRTPITEVRAGDIFDIPGADYHYYVQDVGMLQYMLLRNTYCAWNGMSYSITELVNFLNDRKATKIGNINASIDAAMLKKK